MSITPNFNPLNTPMTEGVLQEKRKEICDAIRSFADLEVGWDGFNGIAPPQSDIDNALDFLNKIPLNFMAPKAMIGGDGDFGFTWRKDEDYVEVGFPDGRISYGAIVDGKRFFDGAPYDNQMPSKLFGLIEKVAKNNRT